MKITQLSLEEFYELSESFPDILDDDLEAVRGYSLLFEMAENKDFSCRYIRPSNFDDILEYYIEKYDDPNYIPYWADYWPSGTVLAEYAVANFNFVGASVLELGSGMGLAALPFTAFGADLLYSDYDPNAFPFIRVNHYLNYSRLPKISKFDWSKDRMQKKFDYIIASDVAYEERLYLPLINVMKNLVTPGGKILLTEPERSFAAKFFYYLTDNDLVYEKKLLETEHNNKHLKIGFYEIIKKYG